MAKIDVNRHPCSFTPAGADESFCQEQSRLPTRNQRCTGCASPWRICSECAKHTQITNKSFAVDGVSGLCAEHKKQFGDSTPDTETLSEDRLALLKDVGDTSLNIPVGLIRPRKDQPRQHFDADELQALADSIKLSGQQQPGIVVQIEPDEDGCRYELDDGERRWRACQLAGVATFRANVIPSRVDEGMRFLRSSIANFNRADHTLLEEVDMVVRLVEEFGLKQVDVAVSLGKHPVWVNQRYGLRRLHPEVRAKLDPKLPKSERLSLPAALRLAPMPPEMQVQLLSSVMGVSQQELTQVVRNAGARHGYEGPRQRAPKDDFRSIRRSLGTARKQLELLKGMNDGDWQNAFRGRSSAELYDLREMLDSLRPLLQDVEARLRLKLR